MGAAAVRPLRATGCDIAIDDLGAGSSGLKAWAEVRPDYVKADRYFGPAARQHDDFIITRSGRYLGLGRTVDLLRLLTAQQIQMAMYSNPLTGLPGNLQIQTQLSQWVQRWRHFVACHLDIDHFKPYKDEYGYARGDQVLLHVAQVITRISRRPVDFVGHVGGDDFVCLLRSQDWALRFSALVEELMVSLPNFHLPEHRCAAGFDGHDRDGGRRRFPLLGVSIGVVEVDGTAPVSAESVLESLRRMKSLAKTKSGSSCLLESRGRVIDLLASALPDEAAAHTSRFERQLSLLPA